MDYGAKNEQCVPGLWHGRASGLPTHFIHPCWQPVYHSHSAVGPHPPNTSTKQRLLLETWYCSHCHTTPRLQRAYACTNKTCGFSLQHYPQLSAITLSICLLATSFPVIKQFWQQSQPASQCALTNSHFRPRCSEVKCHLTALSTHCRLFLSLSFAISNGTHTKVGIHTRKISALSLQPYLTISISFTATISAT